MRPGVVSLFLQVGRSSGFRLLREVKAGEPHISGQRCEVRLSVIDDIYRTVFGSLFQTCLYFPLRLNSVFEM